MTKVDIKIGGIDLVWGSHSVKRKDETHRVMKVKEWLKNNKKDILKMELEKQLDSFIGEAISIDTKNNMQRVIFNSIRTIFGKSFGDIYLKIED